jgi:WD40 repeat protein
VILHRMEAFLLQSCYLRAELIRYASAMSLTRSRLQSIEAAKERLLLFAGLIASADQTVRFWDAVTGKAIGVPMKHEGDVGSALFSSNGQRVVTASADRTARVWDAATGEDIGEPMKHDGKVNSAQFSPDGQRVATASADKTARLWDAVTGKVLCAPIKHDDEAVSARFSPDGLRIVTASWNTARVWDVAKVSGAKTAQASLFFRAIHEGSGVK